MKNLIVKLPLEEQLRRRLLQRNISPDDGRYAASTDHLREYLSAEAHWRACAEVQKVLLETRVEFGKAEQKHLDEVIAAIEKIDPLNMELIEKTITSHDQLAVIEEIGNYVSTETKALLHPGTTSYDVVDTARAYLFKNAWFEVMRPEISRFIESICAHGQVWQNILQVGRTHLQYTSPVPLITTFAGYAARIAERTEKCDTIFGDLRGKVSGIVGTGAGIEIVIGEGKSRQFEQRVLEKLGLKPDLTATQITQKERLADVGNGLVTLMHVLGDFAMDIRLLYSSDIAEVTSRTDEERLGGSSADAGKNNPIQWENICGKVDVVESGMPVLYAQIKTDFQRNGCSSVQGRYQPQQMMVEVYESFCRAINALAELKINRENLAKHLQTVRDFPSETLVAITRKYGWIHPEYGVGHEAVKELAKKAKAEKINLMNAIAMDTPFWNFYQRLPENEKKIVQGKLELYTGSARADAKNNFGYARGVAQKYLEGTVEEPFYV